MAKSGQPAGPGVRGPSLSPSLRKVGMGPSAAGDVGCVLSWPAGGWTGERRRPTGLRSPSEPLLDSADLGENMAGDVSPLPTTDAWHLYSQVTGIRKLEPR